MPDKITITIGSQSSYAPLSDAILNRVIPKISAALAKFHETFYVVTGVQETDCPDCTYDSVSKTSDDPNCGTCQGTGRSYTETWVAIDGVREVITAETLRFSEVGALQVGDVIFTISTAELNRTGLTLDRIKAAKYLRTAEPSAANGYGVVTEVNVVKWRLIKILPDMLLNRLVSADLVIRLYEEVEA